MTEQEKLTLKCYNMSYLIGFTTGTLIDVVSRNNEEMPDHLKDVLNTLINKLVNGMDDSYHWDEEKK